jgi:hypothetical protein
MSNTLARSPVAAPPRRMTQSFGIVALAPVVMAKDLGIR